MSILKDMNLLNKGYKIIINGWWTMIDEFYEDYDKRVEEKKLIKNLENKND